MHAPLSYTLALSLKARMDSSWEIPIPPKLLYTLTLIPVASRETLLFHWWIWYKFTPRIVHIYWCPHASRISLWSLPTRNYIIWTKYLSNSTLLVYWRLSIWLIRDPDPRTHPPSKWHTYEHKSYRWSYFIYSLNLPSTFNAPHCRSISHGFPQKHLCRIHRQWRALYLKFCCPADPGPKQWDKYSSMMLTLAWRHPYALTSLEKHRSLFDQCRPLLEPTVHHHDVFPPLPLINLPNLAKTSRDLTG